MKPNCLLMDLIKELPTQDLRQKYGTDALKRLSIKALIDEFKSLGGDLSELIDPVWFGYTRVRHGDININHYYIMRCDEYYEVFESERGGKHGRTTHRDLESAVFRVVDSLINQTEGAYAIDTRIK